MRKFRVLLIATILVLAIFMFVGCGEGSQNDGSSNGKNQSGPTFTLNDAGDGYVLSSYKLGDERDVVIPDTYEGLPVVEIGANAFNDAKKITSITIPSTVKSIGASAFSFCEKLESIVIPDSVTYIGASAFRYTGLKSVTIGTGIETIGEDAFDSCYGLEGVYISDLGKWCEILFDKHVSGGYGANPLKSAHNLYLNGALVENAVIPEGTTIINDGAFMDSSIKSVSIPDSVTSIGICAFHTCENLTDVSIANGVTGIGREAFYACRKIEEIVVPNSVTTIGEEAFACCDSLERITLPFVGGSLNSTAYDRNYTVLGYVFAAHEYYDSDLVKVEDVPDSNYYYYLPAKLTSVTITGGNILENAFVGCTNITEIICEENVKSVAKDSVDSNTGWYNTFEDGELMYMGKILYGCKGDDLLDHTSITVEDGTVGFAEGAFDDSNLESIELPTSIKFVTGLNTTSLKQIRVPSLAQWCGYDFASSDATPFYGNSELRLCLPGGVANREWENVGGTVVFPDDVTKIGDYAFAYYNHIGYLNLPDTLTSIGEGAFYMCDELITIERFGSGMRSIGRDAFWGCYALLSVSMSQAALDNWCTIDFANEYSTPLNGFNWKNAKGLFLRTINFSHKPVYTPVENLEIPDDVTSINDYAFKYCKNLQTVTIPSSVTSIGKRAFSGCSALNKVNFNGSVSIKEGAFSGCEKLREVNVSKIEDWLGMSFEITDDYKSAYPFYSYISNDNGEHPHKLCVNDEIVTEITIPDSVTSISDYLFYKMTRLTNVTIGNGVKSIGEYAFKGCSGLTSITIPDGVTSIGMYAFNGCYNLTSITIPDSVTSIGGGAFEDCSGVTSITIGKSLTSAADVFIGCAPKLETITVSADNAKLKSVGNCLIETQTVNKNDEYVQIDVLVLGCASSVIPSDGSIKRIAFGAFENCSDLTEITIPVSVESMGNMAFYRSGLQTIYYGGTMAQWQEIDIDYSQPGEVYIGERNVETVVCSDGTLTY